jgi:hypothetical protein
MIPSDSLVVREALELLAEKRAGMELGVGPRLPHLHNFLSKHYEAMMASSTKLREMARTGPDMPSNEELNAFFCSVIDG